MADNKFVELNVLKRLHDALRKIINTNKENQDDAIAKVSARTDEAIAKSNALENESKNFATKDQLEEHKNLAASTYATKEELRSGIGGITSFEFTIVESLPSKGTSSLIYLMKNGAASGDNVYNEYLWIESSNNYERIGSLDVDLSGYLTKSDAETTYATKNDLTTGLSSKAETGHTHSYAGSSSIGGTATSAEKLTKNAGSANNPVYFNNGIPVATDYTIEKSVPSDAQFTDTTYDQADESTLGLVRLYSGKGTNTDGTMTQKAISDAIGTGVSEGTSGSAVNDSDGNPINTTYLKKSDAESIYLSKSDALSTYLSKTDAESTYLGKTATAAKATADGDGSNIANTYLKKASADDMYLTKNSAASTYLGKTATATAAIKLATARTIQISGSVSGSATFDGSGDINIKTTIQYGTEVPTSLDDGVLFCVIEE